MTGTDPYRAVATLYHAYFTGLILTVASRRGAADVGRWVFRTFRRQHQEKFLSSLGKLGLDGLPDAVAAAQYHYLSNRIGGVAVEYMYESDAKAWVRFPHPRWLYEGTALCAVPVEVSRGFLEGWYARNGVSLGNPRLGFVCTDQDMDGGDGLAGYFLQHDRDLAPEERLRFAPGETAPPFDPADAPSLNAEVWTPARLAKANRNYAMEYLKTSLPELIALFGPADGGDLGAAAGQLVARQYYRRVRAMLDLKDGTDTAAFARFMQAMAAAQDDACEWQADGEQALIRWTGWRLMRGQGGVPPAAFDAWNGLWQGALGAHNRFLVLEVLRRPDYGDDCFEWRVRPRAG